MTDIMDPSGERAGGERAVAAAALAPVAPIDAVPPDAAGDAAGDQGGGGFPPPPGEGEGGEGGGRREWPATGPVVPLGIDEEDARWYITPSGRLVGLKPRDHGKMNLVALFDGDDRWMYAHFATTDKDGNVTGWNAMSVMKWLTQRSVEAGGFSRRTSLRGHGAWRPLRDDPTTGLIVHCGDALLFEGAWHDTGRLGTRIYPTKPPLPRPADVPASVEEGRRVLAYLQAVPWTNPDAMARLALGAIGAGFLVGALKCRPMVHFGGDKGSGKSTVMSFVARMLSDWADSAADASEAAVRGMLAGGAKAILLDEMEPEEQRERAAQIVKLARLAWSDTSGGSARGTKDGGTTWTPLQAMFFMASIFPPPMTEADADRFTFLEQRHVSPMPPAWQAAQAQEDALVALGPRLHRRMIEAWPRLEVLIPRLEQVLAVDGHVGRSPVNLSVLLACAEVMTSDEEVEDMDIGLIAAPYDPLDRAERVDDRAGYQRCLTKLLTSSMPDWRDGARRTVAELVAEELRGGAAAGNGEQAELRRLGVRLLRLSHAQAPEGRAGELGLAVANDTEGLALLFEGSPWGRGAWANALRAGPGVCAVRDPVRFTTLARATFVPVNLLDLRVEGAEDGA